MLLIAIQTLWAIHLMHHPSEYANVHPTKRSGISTSLGSARYFLFPESDHACVLGYPGLFGLMRGAASTEGDLEIKQDLAEVT